MENKPKLNYFTRTVPFELAKRLGEAGYNEPAKRYYTSSGRWATWITCLKIVCPAPTYGEVLDWLMQKGIFIQLEPWFTFALYQNYSFCYTVHMRDAENHRFNVIAQEKNECASFGLALEEAIYKSLEALNL